MITAKEIDHLEKKVDCHGPVENLEAWLSFRISFRPEFHRQLSSMRLIKSVFFPTRTEKPVVSGSI